MKNWMSIIFSFLKTRLFRNILFWVIFAGLKYSGADNSLQVLFITIGLSMFAGIAYFNNFFLIPRLLAKRKYILYLVIIIILIYLLTFCYVYLVKLLQIHFPSITIFQVSIISSPVDNDTSLLGIYNDRGFGTYFFTWVEWIFTFTLLWYLNDYAKKQKQIELIQQKQTAMELAFLKNQINPHFLFNTLNNLYALSLKKSDEAPESILKLSTILRYVLYESNAPLIAFEKEKEIMQAYIAIELLRLQNSPLVQFTIESDKPYLIPPLIWLPILENTFKYSRSVDAIEIDYAFQIKNNTIHLFCKNKTSEKAIVNEQGGIGLNNLSKRLELLYPDKHSIHIRTQDNYFIIETKIHL